MSASPLPLALRRSLGRQAVWVFAAMAVAHVVLRGFGWVYEWRWALFQYAFVSIFLVPTVAGAAAWEAVRWSRSVDALQVADRTTRALASMASALWCWVVVAYGAGLLLVVVIVKAHHVPGWPGVVDGLAVQLPALALAGFGVGLGTLVGWRLAHPVVVPIVSMAVFAMLIGAYILLPERVARVGGATADLMGIRVRPAVLVAQVGLFASLAVLAVVAAAASRLPRLDAPVRALGGATLAACVAVAGMGSTRGYWEPVDPQVRCVGEAPALCLAPGYVQLEPRLRRVVTPALEAFDAAGLDRPTALSQRVAPDSPLGEGFVAVSLVLRFPRSAGGYVLGAFLKHRCDTYAEPAATAARTMFGYLEAWDAQRPRLPLAAELRAELQRAMAVLVECSQP